MRWSRNDSLSTGRRPGVVLLLLFAFLFAVAGRVSAAQNGKIVGLVRDGHGRPLIGANVVIEGERLGASTDLNGQYFILRVPPGRVTVTFSAVGFRPYRIEDVRIVSDRTITLNATLHEEALNLEPVTVTYKKPPVDLQETSQRTSVEGDVVREMPVRIVEEIVSVQAGVTKDASGQLHVRGGRSGEIGYFIDGLRVQDPLYGETPTEVGRESLQELQLLSGTFSAEYGEAMSGIVNIITREGSEHYSTSFEYESPMVNKSPYRRADWVRDFSDAVRDSTTGKSLYKPTDVLDTQNPFIPVEGRISGTLAGPLPLVPHATFFVNGVHDAENSYLPFGDSWTRGVSGKLALNPSAGKLTFSFGLRGADYQNYNHTWKYVPEHYHRHFEKNTRISLNWTQTVNPGLYYELHGGVFQRRHDVKVFENWQDYITNHYTPKDFTYARYFYNPSDWSDTWREGRTHTSSVGGKLTWQMNPTHQWRAGVGARSDRIELTDIRQLQIGANGQPDGLLDTYDETPLEADGFLQDKIELDYLVVNAGLRFDYVDPNAKGWTNPENPAYRLRAVKPSYQLSPRLGLAHPISDRWTLHFAYGHFFQFPDYVNLFLNSADLNPDTLSNRTFDAVGNPGLKPQRTVAYEVGLKGVLTDVWGFTATAFYKDITDLVGTRQVRVGAAYNYAAFVNIDYASVVGFELGLARNLSDFWSLQANYTYSVAKGNSSEPLTGYWDAYEGIPQARQEYYMDFDRRHVANALLTWQATRDRYPHLFGTNLLQGASVGLIVNLSSGLPYTPYTGAGEQLAIPNSERMGGIARVDLRIAKTFYFKSLRATLYANVDNLFDRINPYMVDSRTGQPWETTTVGNEIQYDQIHDPSRVGIPRVVRVGVSLSYPTVEAAR